MWLKLVQFLFALSVYGAAVEPRFVVRNDERAAVPNLTAGWEGEPFAVFADPQVGMWWANTNAVRRPVRKVVDARPAIVLIAGDFVYKADSSVADQMQKVVEILQPILDDSIPVYAMLGNHAYSLMNEHSDQENFVARQVQAPLTKAGVRMMDNKALAMTPPGRGRSPADTLYLAGVGEKWAKNDKVTTVVAELPAGAPRILFMHDPVSFVSIPADDAPFAAAAHTHGMELGIPYVSDYLWRHYFSDEGSGVEGWLDGFGQPRNRIYVNRGVGFSILPARIDAVPELPMFTLTHAK